MRNDPNLSCYGVERDEEPLPLGLEWFGCARCGDRWALPPMESPRECLTCRMRGAPGVTMVMETSRKCKGCG